VGEICVSHRTKISFFSSGANQGLKTALSYQASPPETFDEFVQLCIKLDNKAKLLRSQSSRPGPQNAPAHTPAPRPAPSTASGTAAGPMDLSQATRTPGKRGPLSPELRKYRQENHLCMYCGGSGHWASVCPVSSKPKKVNAAMVHGPCGSDYPRSPCMASGTGSGLGQARCAKRFPKDFQEETVVQEDGYPLYRRRNNGDTYVGRNGFSYDNRWVVPYNPYLSYRYQAHINVEVCASIQAIKYIHKYIYKGSDRTTLRLQETANADEVQRHLQGRYIGPCEAIWRLFEFRMHEEYPAVYHLRLLLLLRRRKLPLPRLVPSTRWQKIRALRHQRWPVMERQDASWCHQTCFPCLVFCSFSFFCVG